MRNQDIMAIAAEVVLLLDAYNDEVMKVSDVALLLGKSEVAVRKLCLRHQIPFYKHYGAYYFSRCEITNFLLDKQKNNEVKDQSASTPL